MDFLKYIGAMMTAKKAEADAIHGRLEQRSTLLKHILWTPFSFGIPLLRTLFLKRGRDKK